MTELDKYELIIEYLAKARWLLRDMEFDLKILESEVFFENLDSLLRTVERKYLDDKFTGRIQVFDIVKDCDCKLI